MQTVFEALGGEAVIRRLVDAFYDAMASDPVAADILALHPKDLLGSREKLYLFLVGWSGGPQLYVEKYGHPRLRARHLPFPISTPEAQAWMHCMRQALGQVIKCKDLAGQLEDSFAGIAAHMRNRPDASNERE